MKKTLKWILLITWMVIIFYFSSMPGKESDDKSKYVVYVFNFLGLNLNSILGDMANFVVRKTAHFTEYFILYIFVYNVLCDNFKKSKCLLISLIFVFLYASSDEIHQLFVQGRSSRIQDVLIDTSGGTLALIIKKFNTNLF